MHGEEGIAGAGGEDALLAGHEDRDGVVRRGEWRWLFGACLAHGSLTLPCLSQDADFPNPRFDPQRSEKIWILDIRGGRVSFGHRTEKQGTRSC